jgi:hypothetical protein
MKYTLELQSQLKKSEERKMNYWRGFRSCLFLLLPFIVFLMFVTGILIDSL